MRQSRVVVPVVLLSVVVAIGLAVEWVADDLKQLEAMHHHLFKILRQVVVDLDNDRISPRTLPDRKPQHPRLWARLGPVQGGKHPEMATW